MVQGPEYVPSPEEIKRLTQQIRREWTENKRRAEGPHPPGRGPARIYKLHLRTKERRF